jgi:uncharacterized protein YeaO (DUF488 family)
VSDDEGGEAPCLLPLLDEDGQIHDRYAGAGAAVRMKRAYDPASDYDGYRVLVDRLWPRGVRKETARIDVWMRDLAPSAELRRWFGHDPARWDEFRRRYRAELADPQRRALLDELAQHARRGPLTLLYGARDIAHNNAVVLRDVLTAALSETG